ncbi:two pore domain potassium channel family protein [Nesterenkonia sp. E16_7]|uniref:potassium channel family protein n=1 Tax=unclassified Nesterenkonia TaxID=2629769 RepID=UPI001A92BE06|nr:MULTISPECIES: potassium channel family protein [unclassified Nesterenkonia]MBO0596620.1 two pore domain potassium channel family protein [Nesterenkonia sp. E16_10]MBO0597988.1 two pore domain potassium channel family protein [Nesterenkonia sp. E16_7]
MGTVLTIAGISIILVGLWDMFHQLMHPRGSGRLSGLVFSAVWGLSRATGHRLGFALGPGTMVAIVLLWVLIQGIGWALIYQPHVSEGFLYSDGVNPGDYASFAEALYISLVSLATLGFGDVVAVDPWLRLVTPLQGLTGFALLTGALTWFVQVYPPLLRRRSAALTLRALQETGYAENLHELQPWAAQIEVDRLTERISDICVDLSQHSETYYFQVDAAGVSFSHHLPYALALQRAAEGSPSLEVRMSAAKLGTMLDQLASTLSPSFVSGEGLEQIFAAYAADHPRPR